MTRHAISRPRDVRLLRAARRATLLAAALLLAAAASAAPAALAAGAFIGGVDESPAFLANDHTPVLVHFSASGLTPSTGYYLKVRLTFGTAPSGSTNRGWTYNGTSGQWVQERDNWEKFPVVTSDATGAVTGPADDVWVKVGDERESGERHLMVSLSQTGVSDTLNSSVAPLVTIINTATDCLWVHNGVATGAPSAARAEAVDAVAGTTLLSLARTEVDSVDDDGDGTVDNEDYGPLGAIGDFRLALPLAQPFSVKLGGSSWGPGQNITGAQADVDLALGAADTSPPTAPATLRAVAGSGRIDLSWTAATDDTSGAGVLRYLVYRWPDPAPTGTSQSTNYTSVPIPIASTTATAYADTSVVNDTVYHYTVRAQDSATNLGPRATQADATPDGTPPGPVTALAATPGDGSVHLAWTNPPDPDLAEVCVRRAEGAAPASATDGTAVYSGTGTACDDGALTNGTTYSYAVFTRDVAGNWSIGATLDAVPRQATTLSLAPGKTVVAYGGAATLSGTLTAGGAPLLATSIDIESSTDGTTFTPLQTLPAPLGSLSLLVTPIDKTWYRLHYAGDALHADSYSLIVVVTPRVFLSRPAAPGAARKGATFHVGGSLKPRHDAGAISVTIRCYRWIGGHWRLKKSVAALNVDYSTYTRYSVRLSLPAAGRWQIRAYAHADTGHAATTSRARTVTVR